MNPILLTIILVPVVEIYLLIKIGSHIGAISTIILIFTTAVIGIYYAKYEGHCQYQLLFYLGLNPHSNYL